MDVAAEGFAEAAVLPVLAAPAAELAEPAELVVQLAAAGLVVVVDEPFAAAAAVLVAVGIAVTSAALSELQSGLILVFSRHREGKSDS